MLMNKSLLIILLFLGLSFNLKAQQDAQYTQYIYNTISINPAYAGNRGTFSITGLYRTQWVGLEGAPETSSLNFHAPVGKKRVGLGFSVVNDRLGEGVTERTNFDLAFSYTIPLSRKRKLSLGLKAGGQLFNVDFTLLNQFTEELTFENNIDNRFTPNIGAGIYYHFSNKWYLGFSIPNILQSEHFENENTLVAGGDRTSFIARDRAHYFLMTGYIFELNYAWDFKPTALFRAVRGAPLQLDMSANFLFKKKLLLATSYRFGAAVSASVGFQITRGMLLGLSYDREITELGNTLFNSGSFEVFLRFDLFKTNKRQVSPRFF